jgi:hypothetical protein
MWPFKVKKSRKKLRKKMRCDYMADYLGTRNKSLKFMDTAAFTSAWRVASNIGEAGWKGGVPDIRWRAHVAIWAAQNALRIEGDFVECGVHTGLLSLSICEFLKFGSFSDRKFWLFDTWEGIPMEGVSEGEKLMAARNNATIYKDNVYSVVEKAFSRFPNTRLIKGVLPGSLSKAAFNKIAYLSVDLNNAAPEKASIELLWPKLSSGALVVIDDYDWIDHAEQRDMWDGFAASHDRFVLTLPTGQGLLMK